MPLTKKGKEIMKSMEDTYGERKGKEVFFKMENAGKLKGVAKKPATKKPAGKRKK